VTSPAAEVRIDGRPSGDALRFDRGLHYGDGLFETIDVRDGRARFLSLHADRLARGGDRLGIECDATTVLAEAANALDGEGTLKVIVTRGDPQARGYGTTGHERARALRFWYPGAPVERAVRCDAITLTQRWGENPALAGMKHLNRLEQVLARRELAATGADEGLILSSTGHVVSGTMCNVFLYVDERWVTPRVDRAGIAGVMRAVVLRESARAGLRIEETALDESALTRVSAAFFTNARIGVSVATRLDGRPLAVPAEIESLRAVIETLDA